MIMALAFNGLTLARKIWAFPFSHVGEQHSFSMKSYRLITKGD
jgi:hypothetical protein